VTGAGRTGERIARTGYLVLDYRQTTWRSTFDNVGGTLGYQMKSVSSLSSERRGFVEIFDVAGQVTLEI